jgi:hypothetical protein
MAVLQAVDEKMKHTGSLGIWDAGRKLETNLVEYGGEGRERKTEREREREKEREREMNMNDVLLVWASDYFWEPQTTRKRRRLLGHCIFLGCQGRCIG